MNKRLIVLASAALSAAGGGVLGYVIAWRHLEMKYIKVAENEIEEARRYYAMLNKKDEFSSPQNMAETLYSTLTEGELSDSEVDTHERVMAEVFERARLKPKNIAVAPAKAAPINYNAISSGDKKDVIIDSETQDEPRVISVAEFNANDTGYEKVGLSYFAGDHVLADENDIPIDDVEATVGEANLDRFGHRSRDPRVVYVRNNYLCIDYEITRSEGSFADEVAGVKENNKGPKRFRED